MSVEDPGQLLVTCDGGDHKDCVGQTEMDTTQYAGDPPSWGIDESTLDQNGWLVDGDQTYCPKCRKEYE